MAVSPQRHLLGANKHYKSSVVNGIRFRGLQNTRPQHCLRGHSGYVKSMIRNVIYEVTRLNSYNSFVKSSIYSSKDVTCLFVQTNLESPVTMVLSGNTSEQNNSLEIPDPPSKTAVMDLDSCYAKKYTVHLIRIDSPHK